MGSVHKKAKALQKGDCIYHKGKPWRVNNVKTQREEGETQYSYNHLDKKEVAFTSKGKKRIVTHLECPKTGETYIAMHKPQDLVKVADSGVLDVLYGPPKTKPDGNLAADHIDEEAAYFGTWTFVGIGLEEDDDGQ